MIYNFSFLRLGLARRKFKGMNITGEAKRIEYNYSVLPMGKLPFESYFYYFYI